MAHSAKVSESESVSLSDSASSIELDSDSKDLQQDLLKLIIMLRNKAPVPCQPHTSNYHVDFDKLQENVENGIYKTVDQFKVEFREMCQQTLKANPPYSVLYKRTTQLLVDGLNAILNDLAYAYEKDARPCQACQKTTQPTKTLLCDLCNDPYHTFCLEQPLEKIPVGTWYCGDCCLLEQNLNLHCYLRRAKRKREGRNGSKSATKKRKTKHLDPSEGALTDIGSAHCMSPELLRRDRIIGALPSAPLFPVHVIQWIKLEFNSAPVGPKPKRKSSKTKLPTSQQTTPPQTKPTTSQPTLLSTPTTSSEHKERIGVRTRNSLKKDKSADPLMELPLRSRKSAARPQLAEPVVVGSPQPPPLLLSQEDVLEATLLTDSELEEVKNHMVTDKQDEQQDKHRYATRARSGGKRAKKRYA